jgi:hypothetical protein
LTTAWNGQVKDSKRQSEHASMAAAAYYRGDRESAEELSFRAQEYSIEAAKKTNAAARQTPEPARA